jgi:hypothetical protein
MAKSRIPYLIDTTGLEFEVVKTAEPKVDQSGAQKVDFVSKLPVWSVELNVFAGENQGAEVWTVSVASHTPPPVRWRQPVALVGLEMIPWASQNKDKDLRSGVAFKAADIRPSEFVEQVAA